MINGKKLDLKYKDIRWSIPERVIVFQLVFVLFERFFIQLGAPNSIIYILDILNIYLLLNILAYKNEKKYDLFILTYFLLIGISTFVAIANYGLYGINIVFTILEIRNICRFVIFFLASVYFIKGEHIGILFSVIEIHFWINSLFIVYLYFTYFPPTASWMRGDLLNGFFGNMRGGNTFVNVEMLIVVLFNFVKWTKKEKKMLHLLLTLGMAILIAGLIELKAFFIEIAIIYFWYLLSVKKSRFEKKMNLVVILAAVLIGYISFQIMIKEYPWFADSLRFSSLIESITSKNYSSMNDLNRFTGVFTISDKIFHGNIIDILFGIGLGNGAVSQVAGKTTKFALQYANSNYSWFQITYLFIQVGLIGLCLYFCTFLMLFLKSKTNSYKTFSNMIILLSLFLIFYGEALKTDAGYLVYFSIAIAFMQFKHKGDRKEGVTTI